MNQAENLIQKFGYTEMYEWSNASNKKLGLFVQFDKRNPNKIQPYTGDGVFTVVEESGGRNSEKMGQTEKQCRGGLREKFKYVMN